MQDGRIMRGRRPRCTSLIGHRKRHARHVMNEVKFRLSRSAQTSQSCHVSADSLGHSISVKSGSRSIVASDFGSRSRSLRSRKLCRKLCLMLGRKRPYPRPCPYLWLPHVYYRILTQKYQRSPENDRSLGIALAVPTRCNADTNRCMWLLAHRAVSHPRRTAWHRVGQTALRSSASCSLYRKPW